MNRSRRAFLSKLLNTGASLAVAFHVSAKENRRLCEVHYVPLRKGRVPIKWGLVIVCYPEGYKEAQRIQFPNSHKEIYGGCEVPDNPPSDGDILFCQKCRDSEYEWVLNWIKENRRKNAVSTAIH